MEFLADHHLFKSLSEETLRILYDQAQPKKIKNGTILTKEEEKNRGFFLLRHGLIKITRQHKKNKEVILWIASAGDCPGIDSLFYSDQYKTTSTAIKDSFAYFFPKKSFDETVKQYPSIAFEMMKYISEKISDLETRIFNLNKKKKKEYFIEILIALDSKKGYNNIIPDLISVDEMANLLGIERRYVYSLIKELEENNLISFKDRKLSITNSAELKSHCSLHPL